MENDSLTLDDAAKPENPAGPVAAAPAGSPPWRSSVFWHSDIEDIMDRIANEAMGYHPDSRADFFRDVATAINEHLANVQREAPPRESNSTEGEK